MDDVSVALAVHIVSVVLWIGGVAMTTTVLLPAVRRLRSASEWLPLFTAIERRFARQARLWTLAAGASGFYMVHRMDLWSGFYRAGYWWLYAMVIVWLLFSAMLFVLEPLFLERWLEARARRAPEGTFVLVWGLHWALLAFSLIAVAGAVLGSHGITFSD